MKKKDSGWSYWTYEEDGVEVKVSYSSVFAMLKKDNPKVDLKLLKRITDMLVEGTRGSDKGALSYVRKNRRILEDATLKPKETITKLQNLNGRFIQQLGGLK